MDWDRLKGRLRISSRAVGVLLLAGVLLAACGDDDDGDDADLGADSGTPTVTVPDVDVTTTDDAGDETTATEADTDVTTTEEATEPEGVETPTEEDGTPTEDEDRVAGTPTEDDAVGTPTENDETGTPTEDDATGTAADDDATGTVGIGESTPTESDADTTPTEADGTATDDDVTGDTAEIGETIEGDGFMITVDSIEPFAGLPGVLEPESGNQYLAVTMTIENTGTDPLPLLRALSSLHIEDDSGERYDVDLMASAVLLFNNEGFSDTQLDSNAEVTGSAGFQVPEDADDLVLVIEDATGGMVEVDLSDELQ